MKYIHVSQGKKQFMDTQFAMAKIRENKYLCDMYFTQSN